MLQNNLDCYNNSAIEFDKKIGSLSNYNQCYDQLCQYLGNNSQILDCACGPANISRYLNSKNPSYKFTLMDLSLQMLNIAKSYLPESHLICRDIVDFDLNTQFDCVINGFGLPYLDGLEGQKYFKNVNNALKRNGYFYLSFMNIPKGYNNSTYTRDESPSFSPHSTITVTYWNQDFVLNQLQNLGFCLRNKWNLDYKEMDGSVTTDVIMILQKNNKQNKEYKKVYSL